MAKQTIDIGTTADDGTGDTARAAGTKINANFTELYAGAHVHAATALAAAPADADELPVQDSTASHVLKKLTWLSLRTALRTWFDTLYNHYTHPNHTGDITSTGDGATTLANGVVTNARLASVATGTVKARKTTGSGAPEDCTLSEVLDLVGSAAQGDLLYRSASGWTRLPAGTSGQVLHTQGSGANPQWATPSGGGGGGGTATWQLLSTVNITSAAATVDITGLTGHRRYLIEFENLYGTLDGYALLLRTSSDGGTTWDSGSTDYNWGRSTIGTYSDTRNTASSCELLILLGNAASEGVTGTLELFDPNNAALRTTFAGTLWCSDYNGDDLRGSHIIGRRNAASAVNAIRLTMNAGDIAAGKLRIFAWNE